MGNSMSAEVSLKLQMKRHKTPTVLQMEAVECGAAALSIILSYYGRFEPLEKLRAECGVSRDGSKASNVLKAARKFGLEAKGKRVGLEELDNLNAPVILFWNFNHFLVLEGIRNNKFYLNDPASGPKVVGFADFDNSFTGVILTFEKTETFSSGGRQLSITKALASRLKGSSKAVLFIICTALLLVVPGLTIPSFSKILIDNVILEGLDGWFKPLIIIMLLMACIQFAGTFLQRRALLRFETKLALSGASKFFKHILRLPVNFYFQRYAGDVSSRVEIADKIASLLSEQIAANGLSLLMMFFYAALMYQYDILLTAISVGLALLNVGILKFVANKRKDLNQKLQLENGKLIGQSMTGLQLIETLKSSGGESDFFEQWAGYQARTINSQQRFSAISQLLTVIPVFLTALNSAVIIGTGSFLIMDGVMSIGLLIAFQSLMTFFMTPVNTLVSISATLQETWSDIIRVDDVMKNDTDNMYSPERDRPLTKDIPVQLEGHIQLTDIIFGYSVLAAPLVNKLSLEINPGERIAFVGASGSGKSTIAKIVSGLYPPWSGTVTIDGFSITECPRDQLMATVAMVDQDIFLFEGTVSQNLTMWDESITDQDIIQAAKDAQIHEVISERPNGYESTVDEGGKNFSGGQRQRIEIARSLVRNPSVLILDEATSALDTTTEKLVDSALRRRGCACLIIAHRLSTIRDADKIVVLDHGDIVQTGTHEELLKVKGHYRDLVQMY